MRFMAAQARTVGYSYQAQKYNVDRAVYPDLVFDHGLSASLSPSDSLPQKTDIRGNFTSRPGKLYQTQTHHDQPDGQVPSAERRNW